MTCDNNAGRPIWAPWRIDYIRSPKTGECFICAASESEGSTDGDFLLVAQSRESLVMLNRFPYTPGHLLVSPKRHVGDISDLTLEERADLMDMIVKAKDVLTRSLSPDGFNIGFNLGAVAGAGLAEHIHAHIVPRWSGDTNFMPVLGDVRVVPEALDATWELLRGAWEES